MTTDGRQARIQRSVDSLERLFAVVVGLSITVAVEKVLFDAAGNLYAWYDSASNTYTFLAVLLDRLPAMIAFITSVVPFFHGMNRHLDRTYVEGGVVTDKEGFLVMDFFVFFLESCFLLALASSVGSHDRVFLILAGLLLVDAAWSLVTHGIHYSKNAPSTLTWGWINLLAIALLLLFYFAQVFPAGLVRSWALCLVAVVRTVVDYKLCWRFYFPT
jgi:hypothetical protein